MTKIPVVFLLVAIFASVSGSYAQDKPSYKFGKVGAEDFTVRVPATDSGAHVIMIGDVGSSVITPNNRGGFGYEFQRRLRLKIIDQNGMDAAKFEIPVYSNASNSAKQELQALKAYTYNLEGGKVVQTKLENNQVFTEKISNTLQMKKFTMPALKAGSIIEVYYDITSDFIFNFRPWEFQHDYPCLWSEYNVEIPEYFDFVVLNQGYLPYHITSKSQNTRSFTIRNNMTAESTANNSFTIDGLVENKRWVMKDIPAIREEKFTTTVENHRAKIEFQLNAIKYPQQPIQLVMESWPKVTSDFMKDEDFGAALNQNNNWLDDVTGPLVAGEKDPSTKALKIYSYVRDNFTCTSRSGLYLSNSLKTTLKTKSGNVADINLLLMAMLKHEKIECYPIILSTRSHGITNPVYPLLDRFNYVAAVALVDGGEYMLDATVPDLAFGRLATKCYNGHARVLTDDAIPIMLSPDSVVEKTITMAILIPEKGRLRGKITQTPGYFESLEKRGLIREKGQNAFFDAIKTSYGSDYEITNGSIDSLKQLNNPIKVSYDIELKENDEDVIYMNPILVPAFKENPFESATRHYPVEIPYCLDETYILNMQVPEGYQIDELPKSTRVNFNTDEGSFDYIISASEGNIQLRTRVKLNKATFSAEDYDSLREFFGYVVKKQAEQIVLKKKG